MPPLDAVNIGKQVKIKYSRLAPEELSTCQTEAAHV